MTSTKLTKTGTPVVAILTGSPSDLPVVLKGRDVLDALDIPCDVRVLSAHRTPRETAEYITAAEKLGVEVKYFEAEFYTIIPQIQEEDVFKTNATGIIMTSVNMLRTMIGIRSACSLAAIVPIDMRALATHFTSVESL